MAEVAAWQARPLEPMYPVVFFDALRVKIKEHAVVRKKAIYLALGVLPDGTRDIPGLWIVSLPGGHGDRFRRSRRRRACRVRLHSRG
jgi:transposase-like protein